MDVQIRDCEPLFSIGVVAAKFNISVHTLRMYEAEGLILPFKKESGRRLYSKSDMQRIACIRNLIEKRGLNIAGIKSLLALVPCWEIKGCSESDRAVCEAYTNPTTPCWAVKNKAESCHILECRECKVYQGLSNCNNFKAFLKVNWK